MESDLFTAEWSSYMGYIYICVDAYHIKGITPDEARKLRDALTVAIEQSEHTHTSV
jgi:hypothetical protein